MNEQNRLTTFTNWPVSVLRGKIFFQLISLNFEIILINTKFFSIAGVIYSATIISKGWILLYQ